MQAPESNEVTRVGDAGGGETGVVPTARRSPPCQCLIDEDNLPVDGLYLTTTRTLRMKWTTT